MAEKVKKERALDIFYLLSEFDRKKYDIWDNLSDDQRKEFSPLVAMRWMAGTTSHQQIVFLNEIINVAVFNLPDHKELMMKLLALCSDGSQKRYSWVNYKLSGGSKRKIAVELVASHYNLSLKEAEDSVKLFSSEEILELAEIYGFQKDEIKALKKELS